MELGNWAPKTAQRWAVEILTVADNPLYTSDGDSNVTWKGSSSWRLHILYTKLTVAPSNNTCYRPLSRLLDRCDRVIQNESRDPFDGNVYYVTVQITFHTRKFRNEERNLHCDVVRITTKWVSSLTLDCNGVFAIKAYTLNTTSYNNSNNLVNIMQTICQLSTAVSICDWPLRISQVATLPHHSLVSQ